MFKFTRDTLEPIANFIQFSRKFSIFKKSHGKFSSDESCFCNHAESILSYWPKL